MSRLIIRSIYIYIISSGAACREALQMAMG